MKLNLEVKGEAEQNVLKRKNRPEELINNQTQLTKLNLEENKLPETPILIDTTHRYEKSI